MSRGNGSRRFEAVLCPQIQEAMLECNSTIIKSSRLDLVLLEPDVLCFALARDTTAVERLLGLTVPPEWYDEHAVISLRLQQVTTDPAFQPWSLRAISLRERRQMVGQIGFHTKPGAAYLQPFAPDGVEFGFTVFSAFRRRGYAREACQALLNWAYEQHQISEFVVTIRPDNIPSHRLVQQLGFTQVGSHIDEEDGPEDILKLEYHGADAA
ncbi:MAG TPA: GNAT family N-acetyltransferase [Anaerolineales bacterium]|nr:GNAT family N-acetyltransferase [Anaerolineales bacterium]